MIVVQLVAKDNGIGSCPGNVVNCPGHRTCLGAHIQVCAATRGRIALAGQTAAYDHGPLGFLGSYAKAEDPFEAALAMTNMGPIYTMNQLQQVKREVSSVIEDATAADEIPIAGTTPATGLTMSDFTGSAGFSTP